MLPAESLARTYDPPGYADPLVLVDDYQRFLEHTSEHPNHGRTRVGNALELPAGRVRGWLDGSRPDVIRGLQFADKRGWIGADPDGIVGRSLCVLLTGIYCCGAITDHFQPLWSVSTVEGDTRLWQALRNSSLEGRRNHVDDDRPTELVPTEGATVLGRSLLALGAPDGDKNEAAVAPLPDVILDSGRETRRACAELYVQERAHFYDEKDTIQIQLANRSKAFKRSVVELLRSLTAESVTLGETVTISAAAARDLGFTQDR